MIRFITRRVIEGCIALLGVALVVFVLARTGGSPVDVMLPIEATAEQRAQATARLGLDKPLYEQFGIYLLNVAQGDFGTSIRTRLPAIDLVTSRLANSLLLALAALTIAVAIGVPLGVIAAMRRNGPWDRFASLFALLGLSLPNFFSGILAIWIFAVILGVLPAQGAASWQHYVLPAATMGWFTSAGVTRLVRSGMLEVLGAEYIKLARAEGLPERSVVMRHAFRNAVLPVVTFVGMSYGLLIGAAVATEVVFGFPGLARLAYEAVQWRDFPVLQAVVLVWATIIIGVNFAVDLLYGVLDPRVRLS